MEILERSVDGLIQHVVSINDSQSDFIPERGTTNVIFVVRLMQEKCLSVNTNGMIIMLNKVITERSRELLLDFSLTVKTAPHECVIRSSQP